MTQIQQLITDHLDLWTSAETEKKSGRGRSSGNGDTVYGIKKLRELILELAVRGKLVPQDPKDEPASELLKRIQAEKARLVKEGKIKKEKPLPEIGEDEKLFDAPVGWKWVRLGEISEANTGYAFKSTEYQDQGTFVLRVTNINQDGTIDTSDSKFIDPGLASSTYGSFLLSEGDVLLVMVGGSLGKIGVVSASCLPAVLNQNMWKMVRFGHVSREYFIFGLRYINAHQVVITSSTHGHLAQGEYLSKLVPLPPLPEQHRIVAKVDELMALCDQLETQHNNATDAHEKLVSHLLGTLTQSRDAADFSANWQRIAEHFDTLFTTEHSIDTLKQTLLQLAVMGKLVPQDPNDEPASELLKRIQAEKTKLIAAGRIKNEKPLPQISDEERPFALPGGWEWNLLRDLLNPERDISYGVIKLGVEPKSGGIPVLRCSDVKPGFIMLEDVRKVAEDIESEYLRTRLQGGEILLNIRGTLGGVALVGRDLIGYNVAREVAVVPVSSNLLGTYIVLVMQSNYFWEAILAGLRGIAYKGLNLSELRLFAIPVPPMAEQARIVTKVNELMSLCDQLKCRITKSSRIKQKLADTLVEQALAV